MTIVVSATGSSVAFLPLRTDWKFVYNVKYPMNHELDRVATWMRSAALFQDLQRMINQWAQRVEINGMHEDNHKKKARQLEGLGRYFEDDE